MKTSPSPAATKRWISQAPRPLVLVPTMGALHDGHLALIAEARRLAGPRGSVVVSIFVNPTQFGPKEDLSRYPRPIARDKRLCREAGVDMIFMPRPEQMYAADFSTYVQETALETVACGRSRPGHFRGVCTVVTKLFNLLQPDIAVFGQKDYQQLAIIRRMVRDLDMPVKIAVVATVREADGLALSSRNQYLTEEQRAQAPIIRRALLEAQTLFQKKRAPAALRKLVEKTISTAPHARIDYIEVLDATTLQPATPHTRKVVIATAVFFSTTRLIDNIVLP